MKALKALTLLALLGTSALVAACSSHKTTVVREPTRRTVIERERVIERR